MHGMWKGMTLPDARGATIGLTLMVRAPPTRPLKYLSYIVVRQFVRRAVSLREARPMAAGKREIHRIDKRLRAFVQEVTATLLDGKRHRTPGLGTFSTCSRKGSADRAACKMAMFRASAALREYASGGPPPAVSGPRAELARVIIEAMQSERGIDVPLLGRMAVVPVPGKKPKLIFHGAEELNDVLAAS